MNAALNQAIAADKLKIEALVALRTGAKARAEENGIEIIRDRDYRELDSAIKHMGYIMDLRTQVANGDADQTELDEAIEDMNVFDIH